MQGQRLSILEAFILGIVQGLTEFLPVSSSGHLELGKAILGDTSVPQESMLFTVVVHFATALATMVIYRADIARITAGLFQFKNNNEFRFSLKIVITFKHVLMSYIFIKFFYRCSYSVSICS